jgi:hypothetical protein
MGIEFNPPDPKVGQDLLTYITTDYLNALNAAVKEALEGVSITGGPGIFVSKVGGNITIKTDETTRTPRPPTLDAVELSLDKYGYWVNKEIIDPNTTLPIKVDMLQLDYYEDCVKVGTLNVLGYIVRD